MGGGKSTSKKVQQNMSFESVSGSLHPKLEPALPPRVVPTPPITTAKQLPPSAFSIPISITDTFSTATDLNFLYSAEYSNSIINSLNTGTEAERKLVEETFIPQFTSPPKGLTLPKVQTGDTITEVKAEAASLTPEKRKKAPAKQVKKTKKPKSRKDGKGLRHFSLQVCKKVQEKISTTYNEVAEELVAEVSEESGTANRKNIRRRVYDALNVLFALNIISKEKKEIRWLGLPSHAKKEVLSLKEEQKDRQGRIQKKEEHLEDLRTQYWAYQNLMAKNKTRSPPDDVKLHLPFIIVETSPSTIINCQMTV